MPTVTETPTRWKDIVHAAKILERHGQQVPGITLSLADRIGPPRRRSAAAEEFDDEETGGYLDRDEAETILRGVAKLKDRPAGVQLSLSGSARKKLSAKGQRVATMIERLTTRRR